MLLLYDVPARLRNPSPRDGTAAATYLDSLLRLVL